jgi:hypothetical protein
MSRTTFRSAATSLSLLSALAATALAGCDGGDDGDDDGDHRDDTAPLRAAIAAAPELLVDVRHSAVALHASLDRGERVDEADVTLLVEHGVAAVARDGEALSIDLSLAFASVALPSDLASGELRLIDLDATTVEPLTCTATWTSVVAWCGGTLDVLLTWSLQDGDRVIPLGAQSLRGLEVSVAAMLGEDTLTLQLAGDTEGTVWSWAGIAELRDVSLHVMAEAPRP